MAAPNQILQILQQAGFRGEGLKTAFAIAMRESGGNPDAFNGNASTGDKSYGLFQINMLGGLGPSRMRQFGLSSENQLFDPLTNARVAYQMSRGGSDFGAWGLGPNAYAGAPPAAKSRFYQIYNQYWGGAPQGQSPPPSIGKFERVDQGVDYMASQPVGAVGSGTIESISKGMAGGTGYIIKERLDKPVSVNGRTYSQVYYSEENPLVKAGQRVGLNQAVMQAGGNEFGFLNQNGQMAPLIGGLGAGTKPTQMGQDFLSFMNGRGGLGGASGTLPQPQQDMRQHIVAQKVGVLGSALGSTLLASAQSLLNGGSPDTKNLFTLAKGYQQARKSIGSIAPPRPAPLGGTPLSLNAATGMEPVGTTTGLGKPNQGPATTQRINSPAVA